uniref:Nucleoporin NUP35 n=1 Tax=Macrostomum lignano TaxID=282301 RepID=A0A1I8FMS1_9PLAT
MDSSDPLQQQPADELYEAVVSLLDGGDANHRRRGSDRRRQGIRSGRSILRRRLHRRFPSPTGRQHSVAVSVCPPGRAAPGDPGWSIRLPSNPSASSPIPARRLLALGRFVVAESERYASQMSARMRDCPPCLALHSFQSQTDPDRLPKTQSVEFRSISQIATFSEHRLSTSACRHSMHAEHVQYFYKAGLVACFEYTPIDCDAYYCYCCVPLDITKAIVGVSGEPPHHKRLPLLADIQSIYVKHAYAQKDTVSRLNSIHSGCNAELRAFFDVDRLTADQKLLRWPFLAKAVLSNQWLTALIDRGKACCRRLSWLSPATVACSASCSGSGCCTFCTCWDMHQQPLRGLRRQFLLLHPSLACLLLLLVRRRPVNSGTGSAPDVPTDALKYNPAQRAIKIGNPTASVLDGNSIEQVADLAQFRQLKAGACKFHALRRDILPQGRGGVSSTPSAVRSPGHHWRQVSGPVSIKLPDDRFVLKRVSEFESDSLDVMAPHLLSVRTSPDDGQTVLLTKTLPTCPWRSRCLSGVPNGWCCSGPAVATATFCDSNNIMDYRLILGLADDQEPMLISLFKAQQQQPRRWPPPQVTSAPPRRQPAMAAAGYMPGYLLDEAWNFASWSPSRRSYYSAAAVPRVRILASCTVISSKQQQAPLDAVWRSWVRFADVPAAAAGIVNRSLWQPAVIVPGFPPIRTSPPSPRQSLVAIDFGVGCCCCSNSRQQQQQPPPPPPPPPPSQTSTRFVLGFRNHPQQHQQQQYFSPAASLNNPLDTSAAAGAAGANADDGTWVTVFGFPSGSQLAQCGRIERHTAPAAGANWVHVEVPERVQARRALCRNGRVLSANCMIGVQPCRTRAAAADTSVPAAVSGTRPLAEQKPAASVEFERHGSQSERQLLIHALIGCEPAGHSGCLRCRSRGPRWNSEQVN